jgi:N-methylhydantoinase A/oxoprolinase/acetone carboxylase beta subunit
MERPELRLGVDVGATSTDAALIHPRGRVLATAKVASGADPGGAVGRAIEAVVAAAGVPPGAVCCAMVSTPGLTTAVVERRGLTRAAVLRIGAPFTLAVPPLRTWPADLREAVCAGQDVVRGGADYDGRALTALDEDAVARFASRVGRGADCVAITSVFSPVAPEHELTAAGIVRRELGAGVDIALSHEIGSLGLLDRESATTLNATLGDAARRLTAELGATLEAAGIHAELFVAQHDGTLMGRDHAARFPVLMVGAGVASSIRGAAYLSGALDGTVVDVDADVGGGGARVGALSQGLPRATSEPVRIGGVRLSLRMPEVHSVPVTDGAAPRLDLAALARAVDRATAGPAAPVLIAVGGARGLVPDGLPGVGEVRRPPEGEVAGAVGIATAPVSARIERVCANPREDRARVLERARAAATDRAVHAGADPAAVEVVEVEEVPLTDLAGPGLRIVVRAAGPPDLAGVGP